MADFHSSHLDDLTRQLAFVPPARRRQQIDNAEQLYWQIEPERNYPLEFLTYRITGYRPDTVDDITLVGRAVRHDLLLLVEQLSDSLDESFDDFSPPPYDLDALAEKLSVTTKTISRYRQAGLFVRHLIGPTGRKKLAFLPDSVERFLASRTPSMKRAASFSRIDEDTRHRIITRSRRITARADTSPFKVAQHLARKFDRSPEAIRRLLLEHDKRDPRVAIFPEHTPPLTDKQQRIIYRAYRRGVPVSRLAERFTKARNAIYRAINRQRAQALQNLVIHHIPSYTFHLPDAESVILGSRLPEPTLEPDATHAPDAPLEPRGLDTETERALFSRYNFLKHLADQMRQALDPYQPGSQQIDRIETHLRHAVAIKHQIVRANQGLVIAAARRHMDLTRPNAYADPNALADYISEGNLTMLQTVETFDPGKGNRFSTYLTWGLMRRFAQATRSERGGPRAPTPESSAAPEGATTPLTPETDVAPAGYWAAAMNPRLAEQDHQEDVAHTLQTLLDRLDERERFILTRHFGITPATDASATDEPAPQTLAHIAEQLNISAERARQIEHRALGKLRRIAAELDLDMPITDILSP
ncbi:MAG: sigma-70 family RNA polymerase sigma factor [Planctomycetota bacterium]|jgi:RNA polymerase primary sigma factor